MPREDKKLREKSRQLSYLYGIDKVRYDQMLEQQGFKCAICRTPQSKQKRKLAVDHDHLTGMVRGLLCGRCNLALGQFDDRIDLLQEAIDYLYRF